MNEIQVTATVQLFDDINELPAQAKELMLQAIEARKKAYAPYSKFRVGAALSLDNGEIITGNNQENAAYPSGLCAERVAIYYAGSQYPNAKVLSIAITAASSTVEVNEPISSCGSCRQSIAEYEQKQKSPIAIYFMGETGAVAKVNSLKDLLPLGFDSSYL